MPQAHFFEATSALQGLRFLIEIRAWLLRLLHDIQIHAKHSFVEDCYHCRLAATTETTTFKLVIAYLQILLKVVSKLYTLKEIREPHVTALLDRALFRQVLLFLLYSHGSPKGYRERNSLVVSHSN